MKKKFKRGNAIYNNFNIIKYRKIEINNYVIWYFKTNLKNFKFLINTFEKGYELYKLFTETFDVIQDVIY